MQGNQEALGVHERKDVRMQEYQQAPGVHEPKDVRIPTSTRSS